MDDEAHGEAEHRSRRAITMADDAQGALDVGIDRARGEERVERRRHLGRWNDGLMPDQAGLAGKLERRADHRHDHRKADQAGRASSHGRHARMAERLVERLRRASDPTAGR